MLLEVDGQINNKGTEKRQKGEKESMCGQCDLVVKEPGLISEGVEGGPEPFFKGQEQNTLF